jgi:hypothetical protein
MVTGLIPAFGPDGGNFDLWLGGGDREGPDGIFPSFSEVFSAFTRDLHVIFLSYGCFVTLWTSTVYY